MANRNDVFMLDVSDDADGPCLHVVTPSSVLVVHDAEQLNSLLTQFRDPIASGAVKNTAKERRWYVEKILPALRYYCTRYGVEQPDWLATNGHWMRMSDEEKLELFGKVDLKFREFAPVEQPDIQVIREETEQEQQGG